MCACKRKYTKKVVGYCVCVWEGVGGGGGVGGVAGEEGGWVGGV